MKFLFNNMANEASYRVHKGDGQIVLESSNRQLYTFDWISVENGVRLSGSSLVNDSGFYFKLLNEVFSSQQNVDFIQLKVLSESQLPQFLRSFIENEYLVINKNQFSQISDFWVDDRLRAGMVETWIETDGRSHPKRENLPKGVLYRRYFSHIDKEISFRSVDIDSDLDLFHEWHNKERVYDLWELNQSKDDLKNYLKKGESDPHQTPLILEINGESAGYFEIYWAAEDRIGPYYDYAPFDRGFHFLIGEEKFLGLKNTQSVLFSITQFLFVVDSRTRRIVAEPRSDNKAVLKYLEFVPGWEFIKEFDFPHKRSALLSVKREAFFQGKML